MVSCISCKKQGDVNIDDNIKGISEYAFSGAQIGKVTMGKGLNTIHKKAFAKSTVTDVNMPLPDETKSVNWKADAFLNCASLKKLYSLKALRVLTMRHFTIVRH